LHGDLQLGDVLDGGPSRGLVAVGPKACIGDPCFDAVDYVVAGAGHEGVEVRRQRVATACDELPACPEVNLDRDLVHRAQRSDDHRRMCESARP
jgi:hypothetical protein